MLPPPLVQSTTTAATPPPVPGLPAWAWSAPVRVFVALVVIALGAYASKFVVRLLGRPVARRFHRQSVAQTVLRGVRATVVLVSALFAAALVGLELGNIVLSVTVFSAVLGIVLAPIVGSVLNGLFVLADQPYEIGDMIELSDGTRGFVEDLTLRYTKIITLENTIIVLPNARIREQQVTNYSAEDERTRLSLPLLVTYQSDVDQARRLLERAARQCEEVIEGGPDIRIGTARYPAKPTAYIDEHGDHGVLVTLRYWAQKPYKLLTIRSRVQENLRSLLGDDVDVEIAYPHLPHVFDETTGEARVALRSGDPSTASHDGPVEASSNQRRATEDERSVPDRTDGDGDAER